MSKIEVRIFKGNCGVGVVKVCRGSCTGALKIVSLETLVEAKRKEAKRGLRGHP
jgi:hypothetical protein